MPAELDPASVKLRNVRLSFAHLFTPTASVKDGPLKYRANFLIDPNTADGKANIKALNAARKAVELEKFGKSPMVYKGDRLSIKDGDEQINAKTGEPYDGYEGMTVVSAASDKKFPIVDVDRTPITTAEEGKPYSGCYVNAVVRLYGIKDKDKGGAGLFVGIQAVQFLKHGEPFSGGSVDPDEVFDDESDNQDDDDAPAKPAKKKAKAASADDDAGDEW